MALVITKDKAIDTVPGESLLETLERAGYDMEYQCRDGYCGSCRIKLISGQVAYKKDPLAFVMPPDILPCVCQAKGTIQVQVPPELPDQAARPQPASKALSEAVSEPSIEELKRP